MASDLRIICDSAKFSAAYINIGLGGALVLGFALTGSLPLLRAKPARALREL
jgi:hypothetical protein